MTRSWLLLAVVVGCTVMSDLLTSMEMKRHGEIHDFGPSGIGRALNAMARKKFLILAIVFMAFSFSPLSPWCKRRTSASRFRPPRSASCSKRFWRGCG